MLIGICGKSGSGKTTLANMFVEEKNAIHVDIDKIGHFVLTLDDVKNELIDSFGEEILTNGNVDRKRLGPLVFASKERMDILTEITWKYMEMEIDKIIEDNQNKMIVLDWLLLPKTKYFSMCDKKILLDINISVRMERTLKRDEITKEQFLLRDRAGLDYNKNDFDYVVVDDNKEYLEEMINLL